MTSPGNKPSRIQAIIATLLLCAALGGLLFFILQNSRKPAESIRERQPGMDRTGAAATTANASVFVSGKLIAGPGSPAPELTGSWPRFRGPTGDGASAEKISAVKEWKTLWSVDLGEGYAGASVRDGRVYVLDYDQQSND